LTVFDDGGPCGNVKIQFYNLERWEIENILDDYLGGFFEDSWSWDWAGGKTVEISGPI